MLFAGIRNVRYLKLYRQSYLECHLLKELDKTEARLMFAESLGGVKFFAIGQKSRRVK